MHQRLHCSAVVLLILIAAAGTEFHLPASLHLIHNTLANVQVSSIYRGLALTDVIPYAIAEDPTVPGRIFASDTKASAIYMLTSTPGVAGATWQLYAGSPHIPGWSDGLRSTALLHSPKGLCVGPKGHLFFLDHGVGLALPYVILRRVDAETGQVTTIAGSTSKSGYEDGEGGAALFSTGSVAVICLPDGQVLINDMGSNGAIRRVTCAGDGCVAAPSDPDCPGHKSGLPTWLGLGLGAVLGSALTAAWAYYTVICIKVQGAVQKYRERLYFKVDKNNGANLMEEGGIEHSLEGAEPQPEDNHAVHAPLLLPTSVSFPTDIAHGGTVAASSEMATATAGDSATAADLVSLGSSDGSYVNLIDLDTAEEGGGDAPAAAASAAATAASVAGVDTPAAGGGAAGELEDVPGGDGTGRSLL